MTRIIQTSILVDDESGFTKYLEKEGFSDFHLFPSADKIHLNIYFDNSATIMNYVLRGIENDYMSMHSNKYFYDLDHDWSAEAEDFFKDDNS